MGLKHQSQFVHLCGKTSMCSSRQFHCKRLSFSLTISCRTVSVSTYSPFPSESLHSQSRYCLVGFEKVDALASARRVCLFRWPVNLIRNHVCTEYCKPVTRSSSVCIHDFAGSLTGSHSAMLCSGLSLFLLPSELASISPL